MVISDTVLVKAKLLFNGAYCLSLNIDFAQYGGWRGWYLFAQLCELSDDSN